MGDDTLRNIERSVSRLEVRSRSPASYIGFFALFGIAGAMALSEAIVKVVGLQTFGLMLVAGGASFLWYRWTYEGRRRARLARKYGDEEKARRMVEGTLWVGQTAEELRDTFGSPARRDATVSAASRSEVWTYGRRGPEVQSVTVMLEDGVVVGWSTHGS